MKIFKITDFNPQSKNHVGTSQCVISKTVMYFAPQDSYTAPGSSRECDAIRHPGQVSLLRTRAGIQTTSPPRTRGTRHQMTSL